MADHLKFERYFWFDRQVRKQRYPNAPALADRFGIFQGSRPQQVAS
jgi:hypothetical protein